MPPDTTHDPPTQEQARQRLAAEWEACLPKFRNVLSAFLSRGGGRPPREQVDELLSEVTQELLRKATAYDPQRGLVAWAMGFVRRIVTNGPRRRRRERRQIPVSDLSPAFAQALRDGLATVDEDRPEWRRLRGWLEGLSESERQLIHLRFFDGLTHEELTVACGLASAGAARTRLSRAIDHLRGIAQQEEGGAP